LGTIGFVRGSQLSASNIRHGLREISVPFEGVHGQIEVRVENEHGV
jgi:hypothetical protein